jgi:hypothetical protein
LSVGSQTAYDNGIKGDNNEEGEEEVKLQSEEKNKMKATVSFEKEGWDEIR